MKRIFNLTTLSFHFCKLKLVHMDPDFLIQEQILFDKIFHYSQVSMILTSPWKQMEVKFLVIFIIFLNTRFFPSFGGMNIFGSNGFNYTKYMTSLHREIYLEQTVILLLSVFI